MRKATIQEEQKKKRMIDEAAVRLEMMNADPQDIEKLRSGKGITKVVVDHWEKTAHREEITEKELEMIRKAEVDQNFLCYYLIQDYALLNGGKAYRRYNLYYVGEDEEMYKEEKEKSIMSCKQAPAYVVNVENPKQNKKSESRYVNVDGLLVDASFPYTWIWSDSLF